MPSCPGFAPPFPFWLMGLFPACRTSAPRALMGRIQCVPIPAARSDIPVLHGLLPRKGRHVSAGQSSRHGKARSVSVELRVSAHLAACGSMASGSFFPAPRVTSAALRARRCPPPWIHRRNAGWRERVPPRRGRLAETARRPSSSPRESLVASCGDRTH